MRLLRHCNLDRGFPESKHAYRAEGLFAMAQDGLFFRQVGKVHPQTRAPIVAIALQGVSQQS